MGECFRLFLLCDDGADSSLVLASWISLHGTEHFRIHLLGCTK